MLMLIGYDLTRPANYAALGKALAACCGDPNHLNIHRGHRFVDSDESPAQVRDRIEATLRGRPDGDDRVLVLPAGGSWAQRGLDVGQAGKPTAADWLERHVQASADEVGVLALAYVLHDTEGSDRKVFKEAIESLSIFRAHGYRHPVNSLSLLATDRAPWAVCSELAKSLPNRGGTARPDELLVIPVHPGGAYLGLPAKDVAWFRERGIKLAGPKRRPARPKPALPLLRELPPQSPAVAATA